MLAGCALPPNWSGAWYVAALRLQGCLWEDVGEQRVAGRGAAGAQASKAEGAGSSSAGTPEGPCSMAAGGATGITYPVSPWGMEGKAACRNAALWDAAPWGPASLQGAWTGPAEVARLGAKGGQQIGGLSPWGSFLSLRLRSGVVMSAANALRSPTLDVRHRIWGRYYGRNHVPQIQVFKP